MIHLLDRDQNGLVSYEEFRSFVFLLPESQVSGLLSCTFLSLHTGIAGFF